MHYYRKDHELNNYNILERLLQTINLSYLHYIIDERERERENF